MTEKQVGTDGNADFELKASFLREIGLFGGLGDDLLEHLASRLHVRKYAPGEIVFREGEVGREMFVVLQGEFEVFKRSEQDIEARIALLGEGDWFGEMSILDVQPRSATVRALAHSKLVVVSPADLDDMYRTDVKGYSLFILNIARELSRRLRVADGILANLVTTVLSGMVSARHGSAT